MTGSGSHDDSDGGGAVAKVERMSEHPDLSRAAYCSETGRKRDMQLHGDTRRNRTTRTTTISMTISTMTATTQ